MEPIVLQIRRLITALERVDSAWRREHSLSANERLVITCLINEGPMAPSDLSKFVGITTAGMSTLLDRLEASAYVQRRRNPEDGRRVLVTPTKRALRARIVYERMTREMAETAEGLDLESIRLFLERAEQVAHDRARSLDVES